MNAMNTVFKFILCFSLFLSGFCFAEGGFWNLPVQINDSNTEVVFEVDSTWHLFQGQTKNLSGRIWLRDPGDFSSVQGEIILPVAQFDTDSSGRDKKMRRVMSEDQYKNVVFKLAKVDKLCAPNLITPENICKIILNGTLTIRGVTQNISFPGTITKIDGKYQIKGTAKLDWSTYGVEDPSIFIATVYKDMTVDIKVTL